MLVEILWSLFATGSGAITYFFYRTKNKKLVDIKTLTYDINTTKNVNVDSGQETLSDISDENWDEAQEITW